MKILVTGGAGYIGSFIVRELKSANHEVVVVDDLTSGHEAAIPDTKIVKIDLALEKQDLIDLFTSEKFDGVIHMASFIQMGESFRNPSKYFHNNLISALNILDAMVESETKFIVFSSSAGVYGNPIKTPIEEADPKNPLNPYGETKLMIERFLHWYDQAHGIKYAAIRYFNAAGAAIDGSIGEDHPIESHLIPLIIKAALNETEFSIFGDNYDTPDGTCMRDYVHVIDLAQAHILALESLNSGANSDVYNAGSGKGTTNLEMIKMVEKITEKRLI